MIMGLIALVLIFWLVTGLVTEALIAEKIADMNMIFVFPSDIYNNTKMNWFGCWFCFILLKLFNFFGTFILLSGICVLYVVSFFHWLFTVGRKEN